MVKLAATDETFFSNLVNELSKMGLGLTLLFGLMFILVLDFDFLKSDGSVDSCLFLGVLTVSRSMDERP